MLDDVGERLLHDAVDRQLDAFRQWPRAPRRREADGQAGDAVLVDECLEIRQ